MAQWTYVFSVQQGMEKQGEKLYVQNYIPSLLVARYYLRSRKGMYVKKSKPKILSLQTLNW